MIKEAMRLGAFIFITKVTYDFLNTSVMVLLDHVDDKLEKALETLKEGTEENED